MLNYKNKNFTIRIRETLERFVDVQANDFSQALRQVESDYKNQEIVLDSEDFVEVEFDGSFYISPVIFRITKEEVLEHIEELQKNNIFSKYRKITDEEIKEVLSSIECDELLAKDIINSIKNCIIETLREDIIAK